MGLVFPLRRADKRSAIGQSIVQSAPFSGGWRFADPPYTAAAIAEPLIHLNFDTDKTFVNCKLRIARSSDLSVPIPTAVELSFEFTYRSRNHA